MNELDDPAENVQEKEKPLDYYYPSFEKMTEIPKSVPYDMQDESSVSSTKRFLSVLTDCSCSWNDTQKCPRSELERPRW